MKHRTQILFEPEQYCFLKSLSHREELSLGELVRRFVEEKRRDLFSRSKKDPLSKLIGSIKDEACTSENYKNFLYEPTPSRKIKT